MKASTFKATFPIAIAAILVWLPCACADNGNARDGAVDTDAMAAQFANVARHLEPGGSVYVVASMDGILENWFAKLLEALPDSPEAADVRGALQRTHVFLKQNGFYAAETLGMSSVPQANGLHSLRLFMARSPEARKLPLWLAMTGGEPRRLQALDLLPQNTVLASVSTADPEAFWTVVRRGVAEIGTEAVREGFEAALAEIAEPIGMDLDTLFASLGDEGFYSIQFCEEATVTLPIEDVPFTMPKPDFLIGIAVEDETLPDLLKKHLAGLVEMGIPLEESQVEEATLHTVQLPLPLPVPWQPTLASFHGYLLIGSTPDIVQAAQQARRDNDGLAQAPAFQKAFDGLAWEECNSISYMDPRFGKTLQDYGRHSVENVQAMANDMPPAITALFTMLHNIQQDQPPDSTAMLARNLEGGVLTEGRSTTSGGEMLATAMALPVGFVAGVAGVAIPAFSAHQNFGVEATRSQCINNMRTLEHAKEAYAIMNNLAADEPIFWKDIHQYLGGGEDNFLTCPEGGQQYTCRNPEGRYAGSLGDVSGNNPVVCPHVETFPDHVYQPGMR